MAIKIIEFLKIIAGIMFAIIFVLVSIVVVPAIILWEFTILTITMIIDKYKKSVANKKK